MDLRKCIFTNSDCYKRGRTIKPKGIMVHSTGANNPSLRRYVGPDDGYLGRNANNNHWNMPGVGACVHAFIGRLADGSIATYQTLPWNYRGWHAGGAANNTYISFEICEDGLSDASYFSAVYREAVELCVNLCKLYGLNEKDIICHSEGHARGIASGHADVMHWFPRHGKSMDTFRADVARGLKGEDEMTEQQVKEIVEKALTERDEAIAQANAKIAKWSADAWNEAKQAGLFDGTRPGAPLTRQEAAILCKRLGLIGGRE